MSPINSAAKKKAIAFLDEKNRQLNERHEPQKGNLFRKVEDWPYTLLDDSDLRHLEEMLELTSPKQVLEAITAIWQSQVLIMKDQSLAMVLVPTGSTSHRVVLDSLPLR